MSPELRVWLLWRRPELGDDSHVGAPVYRPLRMARALVEYAIERARDADASRVDFTARATKQAAHALYRSLGFEQRETLLLRRRIDPEEK